MPQAAPEYVARFLPATLVAGVGVGLVLPSLSAAATLSLPPERFATGTALQSMCRQVGLALGIAAVAALVGSRPDVSAFHKTWLFMAVCGIAGGLTVLAVGAQRRAPAAEDLTVSTSAPVSRV